MKVFQIIAILFLFIFAATGVQAQDWGEVMTPDRPLNVRLGRSLNTERVTTIMPGERVRIDFSKDEWSAVFPLTVMDRDEKKATGYVKTKYMKPAKAPAKASWGKLVSPKGMLNVRQKRNRKSNHMVTLRAGEVVKIDFEKDEWVAVFKADESVRDEKRALGYARLKYLFAATKKQLGSIVVQRPDSPVTIENSKPVDKTKMAVDSKPKSDNTPSSVTGKVSTQPKIAPVPETKPAAAKTNPKSPAWGHVITLKRRANVRSDRTAGSHLVSTLKAGDKVRVDFLKRGWYAVFRVAEVEREERLAIGYIYAPLLGEPTPELNVQSLQSTGQGIGQTSGQTADVDQAPVMTKSQSGTAKPAMAQSSSVGSLNGQDHMTIIPQDQGKQPHKGPVPRADMVRHGFKYGIIERNTGSNAAIGRLLIKVYVELTVIPDDSSLRDFARTISKEELGDAKELLLLLYLPGQDTKDLAYGQAKFDATGLTEFWTRRSTLYGTSFLP